MTQTSTIATVVLLAAGVIVNFDDIIDLIGTGGFATIVLFLAAAGAGGYLGGGGDPGTRSVLGLGTAKRNLSAALVVSGQNFGAYSCGIMYGGTLSMRWLTGSVGVEQPTESPGESIDRRTTHG